MTTSTTRALLGAAILIAIGLFLFACNADNQLKTTLSLQNPYCPAGKDSTQALPDILKIDAYRITISGEGFDPMVVKLDGKTKSAPVQNIPKGTDRSLLIEALNDRNQVICRRDLTGMEIKGGKINVVEVSLLAV